MQHALVARLIDADWLFHLGDESEIHIQSNHILKLERHPYHRPHYFSIITQPTDSSFTLSPAVFPQTLVETNSSDSSDTHTSPTTTEPDSDNPNQFDSHHWIPPTSQPVATAQPAPPMKINPSHKTMTETKAPHFGGGIDKKVDPRDFMKSVRLYYRSYNYTDDKEKISDFSLFLKTDSEAEKWYKNDLKAGDKVSFKALEKAFRVRFLHTTKAK